MKGDPARFNPPPYDWTPDGVLTDERRRLQPGDLVPWGHRVFVVREVRDIPEDRWTDEDVHDVAVIRQYTAATGGTWWRTLPYPTPVVVALEPHPVPADPVAAAQRFETEGLAFRLLCEQNLPRYPDGHYPVCAACGEPSPCRDTVAGRVAAQSAADMARYEQEGVCPACQQPVTVREGRETFRWNLDVPAGPPVTFHTRRRCVTQLAKYRQRLSAAGYFRALPAETHQAADAGNEGP
jgi:hypothetical protein